MATIYTQSTNQDPYKAIYGTKGSDVLGLQQQLNKLGAGLKEDSLYGPVTKSAYEKYKTQLTPTTTQAPTNTATGNPQTIGSMFQLPTIQGTSQQETDYLAMQDKLAKGEDIVDTSAIRSKTLADFQDRINAINQVYAGKLNEAKQQGVGRVGQTTAILANRGLVGSARGGAINEQTLTQNREIEDAINQEKALALSAIYNDVNSTATAEAQRRREAMQSGAKNYIEFIKGQDERKSTNISSVASALLAQGIDPSTLTPEEMTNITGKINATSGDVVNAYKQLKLTQDAETRKSDLDTRKTEAEIAKINSDIAKGKVIELGEGSMLYNTETGETFKNPKTYAPKEISAGGEYDLTPKQATLFNQLINQQNKSPLIAAADRTPVLENSIKLVRENPKDAAQQLNLSYAYIQALDTYQSAVREGELTNLNSIDSKIGSLAGSIQKIQNGQIVRPEVAKQIADAAETIVSTIKTSAQAKAKGFESQANVLGIGNAYRAYTNGYTPSYNQSETQRGEADPLGIFN